MSWIELHITASKDQATRIGEELAAFGADAVTFSDGGNQPIFEPSPTTPRIWEETIVVGLFAKQRITDAILKHFQNYGICLKEVADTDWVRLSLDNFQPMRFGDRLWICPSWHLPPDPLAVNVILDPGLAFGTGSHATTALCLEWLAKHVIQGNLIDYGCGSGILGIAALKLGAFRVYAIDNDPQALEFAKANAEQNHIQDHDFITLLPEKALIPAADCLIANILAKPLITLAAEFASLTKVGGNLVLSGILDYQVQDIINAYKPWYSIQEPVFKGEWVLLEGIRANNN